MGRPGAPAQRQASAGGWKQQCSSLHVREVRSLPPTKSSSSSRFGLLTGRVSFLCTRGKANLPEVKQNISRLQLHFPQYCLLGPWGLRTAGPIPGSLGWTHVRSPTCTRAHARTRVRASRHAPLTWSGNPSSPLPPWSRSAAERTSWHIHTNPRRALLPGAALLV